MWNILYGTAELIAVILATILAARDKDVEAIRILVVAVYCRLLRMWERRT